MMTANNSNKQLSLLWYCQLIIIAAMEMSNPFLPLFIHNFKHIDLLTFNTWSILAYLMPLLSAMIFSPIWGKYGDRFGYKNMVIRSIASLGVIQLLIYFNHDVVWFIVLRFIQGAMAGFLLASQSYAIAIVPKNQRSTILSTLQAATASGIVIGPLFGGLIAQMIDYRFIFLMSSIITFIILVVCIRGLSHISSPHDNKSVQHGNEQTGLLPSNTKMYWYFIIIFLSIFLIQTAKFLPQSFLAIYIKHYFSINPFVIGLIYATPAITILLLAKTIGKVFDRFTAAKQKYFFASKYFIIMLIISIIAIYLHVATTNDLVIFIARLVLGISFAGFLPCLYSLACRAKADGYGKMIGYSNTFSKFGNLAGIFLGGIIYQLSNMKMVFYSAIIIYVALMLVYIYLLYSQDAQINE